MMIAVVAYHHKADLVHQPEPELVGQPPTDPTGVLPGLGGSAPIGGIEGHDELLAVLTSLRQQTLRGLTGGGLVQLGHDGVPTEATLTAASLRVIGEVGVEPMAGP